MFLFQLEKSHLSDFYQQCLFDSKKGVWSPWDIKYL